MIIGSRRRTRLIIFFVSTVAGILVGETLGETTVLDEANKAGYVLGQRHLAELERDTSSVLLVDLSRTVEYRGGSIQVLPGSDEEVGLTNNLVGLADVLKSVASSGPSAIFLDWSLALPPTLRKPNSPEFAFHPASLPAFREAYLHLIDTIAEVQRKFPIYFVGDAVEQIRAEGGDTLPRQVRDFTLVSSWLEPGENYPYLALSPIQPITGSTLPSFTSAVVSTLGRQDKLLEQPRRLGLFSAMIEVKGKEHFWIDYGFVPSLIKEAVFQTPVAWITDPGLSARAKGRIVILADLTDPVESDRFAIPLSPQNLLVSHDGINEQIPGSGGLAHGCALLTRLQRPLYALEPGWPERIAFFALSVLLAVLSSSASHVAGLAFKDEVQRERVDYLVEISLLILVTVGIVWFGPKWLAERQLLVPQVESFLAMRVLDLFGLALLIAVTMRHHSKERSSRSA